MRNKFLILLVALACTGVSCNQLLFGGTGVEGILQSTDFGDTFHDINKIDSRNNLNSTSVNSLVFDPNNSGVMYLASSAGVYRTDNIGNNWKLLVTNILVADIAVDPANSSTIYAAGQSGNHGIIIQTTDVGSSWKAVYTEPTTSTVIMSIAIDHANRNSIYAGFDTGEVIHSNDAGSTWTPVTNFDDRILRLRFGPNGNLYALTNQKGLYESRDGGKTFTNLSDALTNGITNFGSNFSSVTQFLDMAFDSKQPSVIYVSAQEGLLRTVDDGANWSYMQMPVRNSQLRTSSIAVNPKDSNNLFAAVGDTLFKSINGGVSWQTKTIPTGQEVREILIDPAQPNVLYFGLGARR